MVSEFERKAWETRSRGDQHPPVMALKMAQDDIERDVFKIRHVIVVLVEDAGNDDVIHTYQAGDLSELASEGALSRAIRIAADNRRG
jgi:hypothetical protein